MNCLYILEINLLSVVSFAIIFSHSEGCLFILLIVSFAVQKLLSLTRSYLDNLMDRGAWCAAVHGVVKSWTQLSDFTLTFHFHVLEKEMATHSSVLAWRIPGTAEPGGLLSPVYGVTQSWTRLKQLSLALVYFCFYFYYCRKWVTEDLALTYVMEYSAFL